MTWVAVAIGGGAVLGYMGTREQVGAAREAGSQQLAATKYAADLQREMFDIINKQQTPYREAGYGALTRINELLPGLTRPISREELLGMPGFQTAIEQGTGAARSIANVGGGGSNVDRAAQKFAIDYTVSQAMPQVLAQRQNIYNTLAGIAGVGQTAQGQVSQMGQNVASNIGQAAIGGATAYGAGQIGAANALAQGYSNIGNQALMYALLKG
jgi:hypothetical protein